MKHLTHYLLTALLFISLVSCGSTSDTLAPKKDLQQEMTERNRGNMTLLARLRQMPGILLKNGVPVLNNTANSLVDGSQEPLYVLNGLIMGSSFSSINELVDNFNVKKIEILKGSGASSYGSRGANGVVLITTYE